MASLVWTTQLNTTGITKVNALAAATLAAPIYIVGTTNLSVIGSESGDSSVDSTYSAFIIAYDSSNNISYTKRINGSGDDSATCIKLYSGLIYMGGNTSSQQLTWGMDSNGTADDTSDDTALSETNPENLLGTIDGFAVKYDKYGYVKWGKRLTNISAIDVDGTYMYLGNNSLLLTCSTTGNDSDEITIYQQMDIGTDTTIHSITNNVGSYVFIGGQTYAQQIGNETTNNLQGTSNGYIYAYQSLSAPLWLKRIGQNNDTSVTRIIYTTDGYIYAAGITTSTLIGTETTSNLLSAQDGFVAKYGASAGEFVASIRVSGTSSGESTIITSIINDSTNSYIYIGGYTTASQLQSSLVISGQSFNTTCESSNNKIGTQDGFFAKLTKSGVFVAVQRIGQSNSSTYITDIKINKSGYVVVVGYTEQSTSFTSGFVSTYTFTTTTTVVSSTPIDYCVNKMNRRNRMSMTCTNVQYNKLVTYGNDPQQSQKMAYSRYLRSNKPYKYIYTPPAAVVSNSGVIITFAGYGSTSGSTAIGSTGVDALVANLEKPITCAIDSAGNMYICDISTRRIYKLTVSTNIIAPFAGNGTSGYLGDGENATDASLDEPEDIAFDTSNNVYICDKNNKCIRKVVNGTITTICGNGTIGYSGDGGDASYATLNYPRGLCIDASNNIYIVDTENSVIRKIDATTNIISTVAGNANAIPTTDLGNGTFATSILVNLRIPRSVYVDSSQNIYIADTGNRRIRKVDATTQKISTYCGTGNGGFNGDNILATAANLNIPVYVTGDASYIYVTDLGHNRVRKINKSTNMITTVIGNGDFEYTGDNIQATSAGLNQPRGLGIDTLGNIYVADTLHSRVRKVYA